MRKFKVGDRVKVVPSVGRKLLRNQTGIVIRVNEDEFLIEFDNDIGGHSGNPEYIGRCWWCFENEMVLIKKNYKNIEQYGIVKFLNSIEKGT
jgi:hypothetical protein